MATISTNWARLEPVLVPSSSFLSSTKVSNPKGCSMEVDKTLDALTLVMKGDVSLTRVQFPPEDRPLASLCLRYSLVTLQLKLSPTEHFALELTIGQSAIRRTKVIIGTHIKEPKQDMSLGGMPTARLPLVIPRNRWIQIIFHVSGIVSCIFGLPPLQSIDTIALCGTARVGILKVSNSEQACIDSTPEGLALFAVPAYAPPVWATAAPFPPRAKSKDADGVAAPQAESSSTKQPPPLSSPRVPAKNCPANPMESSSHSRPTQVLTSPKAVPPVRGSSLPLPARLEPISESRTKKSEHVDTNSAAESVCSSVRTPPLQQLEPAEPPPLPPPPREVLSAPPQPCASPPSPPTLTPSRNPAPATTGYIRLVSSASPRSSQSAKPVPMYGRRRSCPGNDLQRDSNASPDVSSWWDDVGSWGSVDGNGVRGFPNSGNAGSRQGPFSGAGARDRVDGRGGAKAVAPTPPIKPKAKMTPEAERVQRLVASRKRKVGLVGNRASTSGGGGGGGDDSGQAGEAVPKGTRRRRTRRRMQIIRANERQASKMAVAKTLAPSEIPITPAVEKSELLADDAGAEVGSSANAAGSPKYGYGFGYMGILHENGEYEEDEGAGLKGAWSLAISDDDDE